MLVDKAGKTGERKETPVRRLCSIGGSKRLFERATSDCFFCLVPTDIVFKI